MIEFMSGFRPLVFYGQVDPLSKTLYDLAREETETTFEISFQPQGASILDSLSSENRKPALILLEQQADLPHFKQEVRQIKSHPIAQKIPLVVLASPSESDPLSENIDIEGTITFNKPQSLESMKLLIEVVNIMLLQDHSD